MNSFEGLARRYIVRQPRDARPNGVGDPLANSESGVPDGAPALQALECLYDAHHRLALAVAYRILGDRADAEEVVQEAFLAVWRVDQAYDPSKGARRAWLLSIVRNRAIDRLRARRRAPRTGDEVIPEPMDRTDVAAEVVATLDGRAVREALLGLSPEQRAVIELAYFGGLTHTEIAARLSLPLGTVKGRMRLALERLRIALGHWQAG